MMTHPPAAAACRQVRPKSSGVSMSNPEQICNQHQLGCRLGDFSVKNVVSTNLPEDSSFLQQSEKPLRAARCRGNIPWMPRLEELKAEKASHHGTWRMRCEHGCIFGDRKKTKRGWFIPSLTISSHQTAPFLFVLFITKGGIRSSAEIKQMVKCQLFYELGGVGSMFDECCDDELMATTGSDVKGSVSALVLTINLSSYTHTNKGHVYMYVFTITAKTYMPIWIQTWNSTFYKSSHHFEWGPASRRTSHE